MKAKPFFDPVDPKANFPKLEEEILDCWEKQDIFEKSVKNRKGKKSFIFYEGPPTANGKPGIHHVEARVFKDLIPRFKTMQGFYCERKGGWDCHGLPVELEVEKKLGISGKPQIEEYGIEKFNKLCKESVFTYVEEWEKMTKRIGFWIDMGKPYKTLDNTYIESCWRILKELWDKGLLYEDYKVVPYCARCGTSLSSHELALGYKDNVSEMSVYIKFKIKGSKNRYILAWTTTPWTLPGNVALAVGKNANYIEVESNGESYIFAEALQSKLGIIGKVVKKYKGSELIDIEYEPLYDFVKYNKKAYYVIPANFVSLEEGTGVVHTAVMYGEDDFNLGKEFDLPKKHVVNDKGEFVSGVKKEWTNRFVKKVDPEIIDDLDSRGLLFKKEQIFHTYPFCWRCGTPLLYYALTSWYLKTTAVKNSLISNNNSVHWVPEHIKKGRMGEWLETNRDWALSRSRYWGTPFPLWRCASCGKTIAVGSVKELSKLAGRDLSKLDLHRPYIDEIEIRCDKCKKSAKRLPFVLDCWFDSGAMPYAQLHYPFENEDKFKADYPADYICEAIDQTRGWFYTLQAEAALLGLESPYKNVICLGLVLDENGNKMSKSKGNVIDPWEVANEAGVDAMRWYFYSVISSGESFRFSVNLVKDASRRFLLILWNIYNFFISYANIDGWGPSKQLTVKSQQLTILDKWILVRLEQTVKEVTDYLEKYDAYLASASIENFVNDLSLWYIRRSRDRVGPAAENEEDKEAFYQTCYTSLVTLSKLMAPFTPFISDVIYKNLTKRESVHLIDWPEVARQQDGLTVRQLIEDMKKIREIVEKVHAARKDAKIPIRQPLAKVDIYFSKLPNLGKDLLKLAEEELNIKKIVFKKGKGKVILDTKITPELAEEAKTRELIRKIQEERKNMGIDLTESISVTNPWLPLDKKLVQRISKKTLATKLTIGDFKVVSG